MVGCSRVGVGAAVGGFGIDNRSGVKQLRRDPTPKLYGVLS